MGQNVTLTAEDGHQLGAYKATADAPRGGVVVVQEIFGVNGHIRNVTDRFAAEGYTALAPALFDRQKPGFESGYSPDEVAEARKFIQDPDVDAMLRDVKAAIDHLAADGLKVAVVGYCLGGSLAFLSATRLQGLEAAVGYYGGMIAKRADEVPQVPTMLHYGASDHSIPLEDAEAVKAKRPDVEVFIYDADHGFNCDERGTYDAESAKLAWQRTMDHLNKTLG